MKNNLDTVYGKAGVLKLERELSVTLSQISSEGTIYIGYPFVSRDDPDFILDVLYSSQDFGLVVFDFSHFRLDMPSNILSIQQHQARIFSALRAKLYEYPPLLHGRNLAVEPQIISIHESFSQSFNDGAIVSTFADISNYLRKSDLFSSKHYQHLKAFIQKMNWLRPKKRRLGIRRDDSYGAQIREIEREISNLDAFQNKAALEVFDGPQRIRGLAGSGKTIVLAIKAAKMHMEHPEWRILLTFYSRALHQQFETLIRKITNDEPDWSKLSVMHAWGSPTKTGVYYELCNEVKHRPKNWSAAKTEYGSANAFQGVCEELLKTAKNIRPMFDVALIDEAQDLPREFFELIYHATKKPKRIVYAYDELQSLNNLEILPPESLFGVDTDGKPRVTLKNEPNQPKQDHFLPVCYRNPPWVLSSALALGFGIHRPDGVVQMFRELYGWSNAGYRAVNGKIENGSFVHIRRSKSSSPLYFSKLIDTDSSLLFKSFRSKKEERRWIYDDIVRNIEMNELEANDILIIVPDAINVREEFNEFSQLFAKNDYSVHAPGINSNHENILQPNSVAVINIHRAKGNEAPTVYLTGANYCASTVNPRRRRNVLFTALTRSKGWARITGVGESMDRLVSEFNQVKKDEFDLKFTYPTKEKLDEIWTLNKDSDAERVKQGALLEKLLSGRISHNEISDKMKEDILIAYERDAV